MFEDIRKQLIENKEEKIAKFNERLCPNDNNKMLGIRIPILRKMAKEIVKQDEMQYLKEIEELKQEQYMEEKILEGLIIGYSKIDLDTKLELIRKFIPKIDNWMINDTFCPTIKIRKEELEKVWNFINSYLESNKQFEVRFAVIMMLDNFIIEDYVDRVIKELDKINNDGYYAKMAVAWTMAEIGIKFNQKAMKYLKGNNNLDKFTYNKTLQKIIQQKSI
ncbi:MAG: DNA alkylation repair protein, partial [Clostridia bacterium]|nr:DNA alkylation repair protein [Clostridia bacterium]